MTYQAKAVNVIIASPGDVPAEREVVEGVVHRWNAMFSKAQRVVLIPRRWETSAAAEMGAPPQRIIDRQMIDDGDILIGVFWTRLGTPTEHHVSGTADEIEQFLETGRPASLFFSSMPVVPGNYDAGQWQALRDFREAMNKRELVGSFQTHAELSDAVLMSINHQVQNLALFDGETQEGPSPPRNDPEAGADVRASFTSLGGGNSVLTVTNFGTERPAT